MGTSAYQGGGMGQMLQMIIALSDLQDRRKTRQMQESQFKQTMEQRLAEFGFTKQSENYNQVLKALTTALDASVETRQAFGAVLDAMQLPAAVKTAVLQAMINAPETAANMRNRATGRGYAENPALQPQINREAAFAGLTGGGQGAAAQSGLLAQLAQLDPNNPQWLRQLQVGYQAQVGQPMQGAVQQAGLAGGMAPIAAGTAYRGDITPTAAAQIDLEGKRLQLGQITQAQDAATRQVQLDLMSKTGLTTPDILAAITKMDDAAKTMIDKNANQAQRLYAMNRYNSYVRLLGPAAASLGLQLMDDPNKAPEAAGRLERFRNKYHFNNFPAMPPIPGMIPPSGFP